MIGRLNRVVLCQRHNSQRPFLLAFAGPLSLLLCLVALAVTMGPRYQSAGWQPIVNKWRPEVERTNVQTQMPIDTSALYLDVRFERASTYLALPTSAAEDERCLHPDVVYAPQGFAGHNWWMVMTPFPTTDSATYESPDILCSDDGTSWAVPAGGSNPIATAGVGRYLSDPTLFYNDGTLYCFYRDAKAGNPENIVCKTTRDGITWSTASTVIADAAVSTLASPSVRNVKGTFYMWCVDVSAGGNDGVVKRRSASAPLGSYTNASTVTLTGFAGTEDPWHVNVQQFGDKYLLIGTSHPSSDLYLGVSLDGLTFSCQRICDMSAIAGAWDDGMSYQAAFVQRDPQTYDVFYGGQDGTDYFIGRGRLSVLPHPRYNKTPLMRSLEILGTECVGFWPFLDSSGTNIDDLVGLHDLTASEDYGRFDTTPVQRMPIWYLTLNGTDEGAAMAADDDHFTLTDGADDIACSMGAWVKVTSAESGDILSKHNNSGAMQEWRFILSSGKPNVWMYDDSGGNTAYEGRLADAAISVNVWHHVVFTRDATQGESASDGFLIYVDGALVSSAADDGAGTYADMENLASPLMLGYTVSAGPGGTSWFAGSVAMPFLTRKQLTAWEVRMLYEYQKLLMGL